MGTDAAAAHVGIDTLVLNSLGEGMVSDQVDKFALDRTAAFRHGCNVFDFDALDDAELDVLTCASTILDCNESLVPSSANSDADAHDLSACGESSLQCEIAVGQSDLSRENRHLARTTRDVRISRNPKCGAIRIGIVSWGSRGDIQPALALALRLQKHGYCVRLFISANLVSFCMERGVDADAVFADSQAVMSRSGGLEGNDAISCTAGASREWLKDNPDACVPLVQAVDKFAPQAIVCINGFLPSILRLEDRLGIPLIHVALNDRWLDSQSMREGPLRKPTRPSFLACSPHLVDPPSSAALLHTTGPWMLDDPTVPLQAADVGLVAKLCRFIASGPPPVAIGWGSMLSKGCSPTDMLRLAIRTLKLSGRRGVVLGGWAQLDVLGSRLIAGAQPPELLGAGFEDLVDYAQGHVCFVAEAPHAWLLPQCACFVHHGGSGTTHAALLAGIPAVVTPIFGDQFEFAARVERQGAGVSFQEPLAQITAEKLATAVASAAACHKAASAISEKMRCENGVDKAASLLDKFFLDEVATGRWSQKFHSARRLRERRSKMATEHWLSR